MELRVLRYFLAVAREESISGAAEALHVTQPTLSRQMMELEEELGKTLFLRGKRKISLTEEGMFLRKRAQEIITLVEKTESEFSAAEETISGDVHIGGGETDAMRLIARAAHRLQSAYPHIALGRADAKRLPARGKGNDKAAGSAGPSAPRFQPASGEKRIFRMVRRRL